MKQVGEPRDAIGRPHPRECYRVADLTIDVGAMRVWQDGQERRLPPLSFELLILLVRRAPDVVSRDECLATIWRGVVVGPETLKQRVKLLREALADDSRRPRYVETVRGSGYRLRPPVELANEQADDWPTRLRSRLRGLLGAGSAGGRRGSGGLPVGAILFVGSLSMAAAGLGRGAAVSAGGDSPAPARSPAAEAVAECASPGPTPDPMAGAEGDCR
jgi:DNA-binding winged helix-turn-helix (wHTH) protein